MAKVMVLAVVLLLAYSDPNQGQPGHESKKADQGKVPVYRPAPATFIGGPTPDKLRPETKQEKANQLWPKFLERLVDPVTWFTGLLFLVGLWQWRAMSGGLIETRRSNAAIERSNELAEKALVYGMRSWLIPDIDENSPFKGDTGWKVVFYISNTGSVPGVMVNAFARVDTDPEFQRSHPQMFGTRGAIIIPGSVGEKGGLRVTADVPADIPEEQLLATTGAKLCVSCSIKYKDVLSDEWETEVAWIHGHGRRWYNHPYFPIKLT